MKQSIWRNADFGEGDEKRGVLEGELKREVLIVGAGMTGILTAYFLQQQGVKAAILEAETAGGGRSGGKVKFRGSGT